MVLASGLLRIVIALMPPYMLPTEADVRLNIPVLLFTLARLRGVPAILVRLPRPRGRPARAEPERDAEGRRALARRRQPSAASCARHRGVRAGPDAAGRRRPGHSQPVHARQPGPRLPDGAAAHLLPADRHRIGSPTNSRSTPSTGSCIERVQALPGVVSASVSTGMPVRGTSVGMQFDIAGKPAVDAARAAGRRLQHGHTRLLPDVRHTYHARPGIYPGRPGRKPFRSRSSTRRSSGTTSQIVDPLTQRLRGPAADSRGEAEPVRPSNGTSSACTHDVRNAGPAIEEFPEIDVPFSQSPWPAARVAVRTAGEPTGCSRASPRSCSRWTPTCRWPT